MGGFYTKVLGEPAFHMDSWYGWGEGGQLVIGSHSDMSGTSAQPQRMMLMVEVDDVAAEFDRITRLGAGTVAKPYQPDGGDGGWRPRSRTPTGTVRLHTPMTGE